MYTKEHIAHHVSQIEPLKIDPAVEVETTQFGLAVHLFDPVSGQIITMAQPHRADIGQPEILLTAKQAAAAVAAARTVHLHNVRSMGYLGLDDYNAAMVRDGVSRDLAHKQETERLALETSHAEARAKAAEEASAPQREAARKHQDEVEAEKTRRLQPGYVGRDDINDPMNQDDVARLARERELARQQEVARVAREQSQPLPV